MNLTDWSMGILPSQQLHDVANRMLGGPKPITVPIRDGPDQARGYREVDVLYSCIPDPTYPWDPTVLKAIQEFAPDTTPLWVQWVFLRPNSREKVVFGRHGLGRHITKPGYELSPFRCAMPTMPCQGVTFERPNKIWFIHDGVRNPDFPDIPGNYLPFDSGILHRARESVADSEQLSDREFREMMMEIMLRRPLREEEKRRLARLDEWEQRGKDLQAYGQKQLDKLSDVEIAEYQRSVGQRGREKKPFVQVGK